MRTWKADDGHHHYEPDCNVTLVLEIKGMETEQGRAKHQAARRWAEAINNWGTLGRWGFHVSKDPQMVGRELKHLVRTI